MSITVERLQVEVGADVGKAIAGMDKVEARASRTQKRLRGNGATLAATFGGAAIIGGIKRSIQLAMSFDQTIRQVGIQTGQTGKGLKSLSELALKMGADTAFSAQDASAAMLDLAKGGLTAADIKAGALQTTLTLAAAGNLDMANSAGYVVQALNTFGISADNANQVAVALAGGANASTASVESLGMALSQVGPGASNAGMSLQETVAALAAFDNAGIKGSDAGTSLKTMLSSLVPSTDQARSAMEKYGLEFVKRNGDFKSMAQVAQELQDGLGGLSQAERTAALRTIFGSDATRAATVLMKEGRKGVEDYVKATKNRATVEKMAASATEGATGKWEQLKGAVETLAIRVGTALLPTFVDLVEGLTDAADAADDKVVPALEAIVGGAKDLIRKVRPAITAVVDLLEDMIPSAEDAGSVFQDVLLPSVGAVADVVRVAAEALDSLPGPVKELAGQAVIAAVVFPRLAGAVNATTAAFVSGARAAGTYYTVLRGGAASSAAATAAAQRLAGAARMAAGVGGMLALTQATQTTNDKTSVLLTTLGGAGLGASLAGPWGAAAGAVLGFGYGIASVREKHAQAADEARKSKEVQAAMFRELSTGAADYRGTLDSVTGAITRQTREAIVQRAQESGALSLAQRLGIASRDLVGATLGREGATKRLTRALNENADALTGPEQEQFNAWLRNNAGAFARAQDDATEATRALTSWKNATKGLPPKVVSELKQIGADISMRQLERLRKQYNLTPPQVQTVMKAVGTETVIRKVNGVYQLFRDGKKLNPNLQPWLTEMERGLNRGERNVKNRMGTIDELLGGDLGPANLEPFRGSVRRGIDGARGDAASGAPGVGAALAEGAASGVRARASALAAEAAGMVARAIREAKYAARIASPSKRTRDEVGKPLADGVIKGMKERRKKLMESGREMIQGLVGGITQGFPTVKRTMRQLSRWVTKAYDGAREKKWLERIQETTGRLRKLYGRREELTKAHTRAMAVLQARRQERADFIQQTVAGMTSQATVLNAGDDVGTIRQSLLAQVAKVKKFASMLKRLKAMGFSNAVISQVAGAGVEGGWQAAQALIQASRQDVRSINTSFRDIKATADQTARQLGNQMYGAGIRAAEGVVQGLRARRKALQDFILAIARNMRTALLAAIGAKPTTPGRGGGPGRPGNGGGGNGGGGGTTLGRFAPPPPSAAAMSGGTSSGGTTFNFVTHNPKDEPQSRTTNRALAKVASLGLV